MSGIPQGGEIQVNSTTAGDQTTVVSATQYTPRAIASDATGNFVVTWTSADADGQGVYARLYDSAGNALPLGEFQVNTTTDEDQKNAVVAMDADGDFVIVWESYDSAGFFTGIYGQRFDSTGTAQGAEFQVIGDGLNFPANEQASVAIDPDSSEFVVTWTEGFSGDILAQRYDNAGNTVGGLITVSTEAGLNTHSSVAVDASGNFVVVWTNDRADGSGAGIYGQRFDSAGNAVGSNFLINNTTTGRQQFPSVAMDQSGNFVVAWETEDQDGEGFGIYARRYDSSGAALDDEFQVNLEFYPGDRSGFLPIQEGNQRYPVVSYELDGDSFAIAWTDDESGTEQTVVKRFNEFGTAQGLDTVANVNNVGDKVAPAIAIDSESDFVATWSSLNGGSDLDVYARRFGRATADAPTDIDLTSSTDIVIVPNTSIEISETTTPGTIVALITGTDAVTPSNNLTFSLVDETDFDASAFSIINGNELELLDTPDADTQPFYRIKLRATDTDGRIYDEIFEIFVSDISDEAPTDIELSNDTIDEASPAGTLVATLTAVDPDVSDTDFTFRLVSGAGSTDNGSFSIAPGTNDLVIDVVPDFETQQSYDIRIEVEDPSGLTYQEAITIFVNDLGDPTDIILSNDTIAENSTDLTIGTLTAIDPTPSDTFTFELVAGDGDDNNADFTITDDVLSINASPDFETRPSYSIRVRVTDASMLSYEEVFTITVTDQEFEVAPSNITLDGSSVEDSILENQPIGALVGILAADDPELPPTSTDVLTFSLTDGFGNNDLFQIGGTDGNELQLAFVPDFENPEDPPGTNTYTVQVIATDAGGNESAPQTFTINVTDSAFELAPTDITLDNTAIDENTTDAVVGNLTADDPELPGDTITLSLPDGFGDNADFTIVGTELRFVGSPDFETQASYSIQILATDAGGNSFAEDFTVTVNDLLELAPTDITLDNTAIDENTTDALVGNLSAEDPELPGDTITFSLPDGFGDNADFTIVGTELRFVGSPDFETQDSYSIQILATDSGGNSFAEDFTVTVNDLFELAPTDITLDNTAIDENTTDAVVGNLSAEDPELPGDTITFSLPDGFGDNAAFTIVGTELRFVGSPDFETQDSYSIQILATDAGDNSFAEDFTITVNDLFELAPTDITLDNTAIDENTTDAVVGNLSADDPELPGDTITFSLPDGFGDNADFTIVGTELRFVGSPDFETQDSYSIQILATDAGDNSFAEDFIVTVNDLLELAPTDITLDNTVIDENTTDALVGNLSADDPELPGDTITFSLPDGFGDNADFTIVGTELRFVGSPDFETQDSYSIQILATDAGGNSFAEDFTVTVNDLFDVTPTDVALDNTTVDENLPVGTTVGILSATDSEIAQGDTLTFSLPAGTDDNDLFQIGGINGDELQLNFVPDFETQNSYTVQVVATDAGGNAAAPQTFTITIGDVDPESLLPPTDITLDNTAIDENTTDAVVGNLSAEDPELPGDTITFSLPDGFGDNADFTIVGTELRFVGSPDFETQDSYSIQILATDAGGNNFAEEFTITVNDLFEVPPDSISLSNDTIVENSVDLTIGTLTATDPESGQGDDTFIFTLPAGLDDNDLFTITDDVLSINTSPDFETQDSYTIQVQVEDEGGNTFQDTFTITVTDAFDVTPTDVTLDNTTVDENLPVGTAVGTLSATDSEIAQGDTLTFSLSAGVDDNDLFQIGGANGDELQLNFVPDFETQNSYTVQVVATDSSSNASAPQPFTITIGDIDPESTEPPTDILLSEDRVDENVAPGTVIGTLDAVDPDDTTGFTFSKVDTPGFDNDAFTVEGNELRIAISPDFETKTLYRVRLQVADASGNDFEKDFLITVNNLPENRQPTDIVLSSTAIAEESPAGSTVGTLITQDPDLDDTFTYTLVDEAGLDTDSFTITDNLLTINDSPDFETQSSYRIKIRTTDAGGLFREELFDIVVLNTQENNPPTSLTLSGTSVAENSPVGTVVGSFIGVDPDPGDNLTYTFVDGAGDADNGLFQIQGNQLRILESPDFEQQELYTVRVQGSDRQNNTIEEAFTIRVLDQPESGPGTNFPVLDLNGSEPGVNFAKTFETNEPTTLMSPNATLTDTDSTNLVSAAVVISNPLDTPSEILEVDTSGTSIRAEYNTTGVLNLIGNAPLEDYLRVLKTVTYSNLVPFDTAEPRSLVFVLDDGVNTNEVATTELTPIINNTVSGTPGDDPSLETTPRTDIINAAGGNDTVTSIFGNLLQQDQIDGGDGFDRFRLTNGSGNLFVDVTGTNQVSGLSPTTVISNFEEFNFTGFRGTVQMTGGDTQVDRFIGGNGNDTLLGLGQGDFLSGGIGNDVLDGGSGDDTLNGDAGNDLLVGGEGNDLLRGGIGNDRYVVSNTNGIISEDAGEGIDQVQSSITFALPENVENLFLEGDALRGVGNASRNRLRGNTRNNRLLGSGGNDVIISLAGDDRLVGGAGNDRLLGGGDDDLLKGVSGDDRLIGGAGDDRLLGGGGDDLIKGIGGRDRLVGNAGNDRLLGGAGNDRLLGGGGNDRLVGNAGRNIMIGNAGSDRFVLAQPSSFTRVKDFSAEQNDKLVLIGRLSFGDVTLSQQGANTVIFQDDTRIALIEGVNANSLTAANFV